MVDLSKRDLLKLSGLAGGAVALGSGLSGCGLGSSANAATGLSPEKNTLFASLTPLPSFRALPDGLRFLDEDSLPTLFHFPRDMDRRDGPINRLDNQALVMLYDKDWQELSHR